MKWKNYNQENGYYFVTATLRNFTPLFAGGYQKNKNIRDTSIALQKKYLENMGSAPPGVPRRPSIAGGKRAFSAKLYR